MLLRLSHWSFIGQEFFPSSSCTIFYLINPQLKMYSDKSISNTQIVFIQKEKYSTFGKVIVFDFKLVSVTLQQIIVAALSILEHPTRFLAA